jgi:hypothetical protein
MRAILLIIMNFHSHKDNIVKREAAESILQPHLGIIQAVCLKGFKAWVEFSNGMPHLRAPLATRTMANFVNDWVVQEARIAFDSVAGVKQGDEASSFCLCIENTLVLRFKKLDNDDATSNIRTKRQADIDAQFFEFPGWEATTLVSAGYHFTRAGDAIDRIKITCHYLAELLWWIPVYDAGASGASDLLPFPEPPTAPTVPEKKSRVKPKDLNMPEGYE